MTKAEDEQKKLKDEQAAKEARERELRDKATRDKAYAGMMADDMDMGDMPFDGKRMVYGGFIPILSLGKTG